MNVNAKKIGDMITNIILALSVALFIYSIITVVTKEDNPNEAFLLGYKPIYVKTASMEPSLKTNGLAIVEEAKYNDVIVGDIIMYEFDDKLITHRVIDITDEGIRTKGDNNNVQDAYLLQPEHVKGKVVLIWNWFSEFAVFTADPLGSLSFETLPVITTALLVIIVLIVLFTCKCLIISAIKRKRLIRINSNGEKRASSKEETAGTYYLPKI